MKRIITGLLMVGLLSGAAGAREMRYPPQGEAAPVSDSGGHSSNVLPLIAIAGAVVTTGLILFHVHKVKQTRAARFNVYVMAKEVK